METKKLTFGKGNAKLKGIYTFSLPSGHACPFAMECLSKADQISGKITDGKQTVFRCFSASNESVFPNVRVSRWNNFKTLLANKNNMFELLNANIPNKAKIVRLHVGGDFFNQSYFDAWLKIAKSNPNKLFYAYTKSLNYWIARIDSMPANFKLVASFGGKLDHLISIYNLKFAKVVYSLEQAKKEKLQIDHDDSHAYKGNKSFALLIHGTQPKNSKGSIAQKELRAKGINFSYSK